MEVKLEEWRPLSSNRLQKLHHMVSTHKTYLLVRKDIFKLESWGDVCNTCRCCYPDFKFQLLSLGDKKAQLLVRRTLDAV
jgi:hypothetical protein